MSPACNPLRLVSSRLILTTTYRIFIFISTLSPAFLSAQVMPFEHYSVRDGLPSNWISAIYQDSFGYIWLGSDEGITKYDGVSFTNYGYSEGLPVNHVWSVTGSKKYPGTLWVGTHGGGLCRFSDNAFVPVTLDESFSSNVVLEAVEDDLGRVWCATNDGLFLVVDDTVVVLDDFERTPVPFIYLDEQRYIWVGIGNRLFKIHSHTGEFTIFDPGLAPDDYLSCIDKDEEGNIWLGTASGMLLYVDEYLPDEFTVVASVSIGGYLNRVVSDGRGSVWIAHNFNGVYVASIHGDRIDVIHYSTENGLIDNRVSDCFIDREDNLWLGNYTRGLSKLSHKNISFFPIKHPYLAATPGNGRLYLVAEGGVYEILETSPGAWTNIFHPLEGEPYSITVDKEGNLVLLFIDVIRYYRIIPDDTGSRMELMKEYRGGVDFPPGKSSSIRIDNKNTLWCFMEDTVIAFDREAGSRHMIYTTGDGMPGSDVRVLLHDRGGDFWFGDFVGGISKFSKHENGMQFRRKYTVRDGLPDNGIRAIFQKSDGDIWIGTRFGGAAVIREDSVVRTYSVLDGLLSNGVWGFAEDSNGRLWIATSLGINVLEPGGEKLDAIHRLKGYYTGSIGITDNGDIWAVGRNEIIFYKHPRDRRTEYPPAVEITGLRVNGKEVDPVRSHRFSHDENFIVIHFSGISYRDEKNVRYRYRLIGLDTTWSEPIAGRFVTYGSLHPAGYVFEVVAVTSDSTMSLVPATLAFTVFPPLWKRWWFIILSLVCLVALLAGLEQLRVRRLLKIERLRSTIATDLHDDIGAGLTHIGLLSEVMIRKYRTGEERRTGSSTAAPDAPDQSEYMRSVDRIGEISRELSGAMGDVVWSINPNYDSLEALLKRSSRFAQEMCKTRDIRLEFTHPDNPNRIRINPEIRRNLLLILKEAVTNAVKYSGSASIEVSIRYTDPLLSISVKDYGVGFDVGARETGNGLGNIRNRTEKIRGTCTIQSVVNRGTTVEVTVPLSG